MCVNILCAMCRKAAGRVNCPRNSFHPIVLFSFLFFFGSHFNMTILLHCVVLFENFRQCIEYFTFRVIEKEQGVVVLIVLLI